MEGLPQISPINCRTSVPLSHSQNPMRPSEDLSESPSYHMVMSWNMRRRPVHQDTSEYSTRCLVSNRSVWISPAVQDISRYSPSHLGRSFWRHPGLQDTSRDPPINKVSYPPGNTWKPPASREPSRYSTSSLVIDRNVWKSSAAQNISRYSTSHLGRSPWKHPEHQDTSRDPPINKASCPPGNTWKSPASRVPSRYFISDDVTPQSYAHAYPLILLHLKTELIRIYVSVSVCLSLSPIPAVPVDSLIVHP